MFVVEEYKKHPGFYCIVDRREVEVNSSTSGWFLHRDGKIQIFVGMITQKPEDMLGLWNDRNEAEKFLSEYNKVRGMQMRNSSLEELDQILSMVDYPEV